MRYFNRNVLFVISIAIIASLIAISPVIVGAIHTPPGMHYLWTGHHYLDYFEYIQSISQGKWGNWLLENPYTTDSSIAHVFGQWQYLIYGKIGRLFHLSSITTYWAMVIIYSFLFAILIFATIKKLLRESRFHQQIAAYLLTLFATSFFIIKPDGFPIRLFSFWNDKGTIFKRFPPIPYHLAAYILSLLVIFIMSTTFDRLPKLSHKSLIVRGIITEVLLLFLTTFSPASVVLIMCAFLITSACLYIKYLLTKKAILASKVFMYTAIITAITVSAGIAAQYYVIGAYFGGVSAFETSWQIRLPFHEFILTTGPLLLLGVLGTPLFFRSLTTIRLMMISYTLISFSFLLTPIASLLGTTNTRFLTPIPYILLGSTAVLPFKNKWILTTVTMLLLFMFTLGTISEFHSIIHDPNISSPLSYIPEEIILGFEKLNELPGEKAVLTTPTLFLGALLPIYINRRVYLGRPVTTPNYWEKNALADKFYLGGMNPEQAPEFFQKNNIGFVVLTSLENYPIQPLNAYRFLKNVFSNRQISIFEVIPLN